MKEDEFKDSEEKREWTNFFVVLCAVTACALLFASTSFAQAATDQGNDARTTIQYTVRVDDNDYVLRVLTTPRDSIASMEMDKGRNALLVNLVPNRGNGTLTI